MRSRVLFPSLAAGAFALSLALAGPALAYSAGRAASGPRSAHRVFASPLLTTATRNATPFFAGYHAQITRGQFRVMTTFVVPKVTGCGRRETGIAPSAGVFVREAQSSSAAVFVGCHNGKADYFPQLTLNSSSTNYTKVKLHPGDEVVLTTFENANRTIVTVADRTAYTKTTATGAGGTFLGDPFVGDMGWPKANSQNLEPVPNFGKIAFSRSKIGKTPLGSVKALFRDFRVDAHHPSEVEIQTTKLGSDMESFKTIFKNP